MVVVVGRSPAPGVVLLLAALLLIACTGATGVAAATGGSSTICDTAQCGKGTCSEVPGLIPGTAAYKCTCDPGWSQPKLLNLTVFDFSPCMIPDCTFDTSCYNFSFLLTPPKGIPLTDPCVAVNCGSGDCKKGDGFSFRCECYQGYANFLNLTMLPCLKNCSFGDDCSKLGIGQTTAPPPPPSTTPTGSVSSWRLLLLSLAMLLLVV